MSRTQILNNKNKLKVVYLNCNVLTENKKVDLITTIKETMHNCSFPHIICLSNPALSILPNYKHQYFPSRDKGNGGILFYIHNSLQWSHANELDIPSSSKILYSTDIRWIKVNFKTCESNYFLVGCVYINPSTVAYRYIEPIFWSLYQAKESGIPFLIGGDFNAKHSLWNNESIASNAMGDKLFNFVTHHNLPILNSISQQYIEPTHYYSGGSSVIDLAIVSDTEYFHSFKVLEHGLYCASDHTAIECVLSSSLSQADNQSTSFVHETWRCANTPDSIWKNNYQIILNDSLVTWFNRYSNKYKNQQTKSINYEQYTQEDINNLWEDLSNIILVTAAETVGRKLIKPNHKFWFNTPHIRNLFIEQRSLRSKYLKLISRSMNRSVIPDHILCIRDRYRSKRKEFLQAIRNEKREKWSELIEQLYTTTENGVQKLHKQVQWSIWKRVNRKNKSDITHIVDEFNNAPKTGSSK
jgi:hypothetical protein